MYAWYSTSSQLLVSRLYSQCSYPSPQKAKKKPLAQMTPADLGVDITPSLSVLSVEDPPTREAGSKVEDVDQLIVKLKESGVI